MRGAQGMTAVAVAAAAAAASGWEMVVRTYFSQIFQTGKKFPYHV